MLHEQDGFRCASLIVSPRGGTSGPGVPEGTQPVGARQAGREGSAVVAEPAVTPQRVGNVSVRAARA